MYGDLGVLKIASDAAGRAMLPEGSWRLHSYTIDRTGDDQTDEQTDASPSLLQRLAGTMWGGGQPARTGPTRVSARMTGEHAAFEVRAGETAELQFGPPYTPKVSVAYLRDDQLSLDLSLVGVGGEVCSNLIIKGGRPAKPAFTITDPEGNIVQRGTFEYG